MAEQKQSILKRLLPRDSSESHRAASPLELLFDLTFVVSVSVSAGAYAHAILENHFHQAILGFATVFFGIWWAWMNFTWFASAYDNDDVLYRLLTLVQMFGVVILALGIPKALEASEFNIMVYGYVIMRVAMVAQWVRASFSDPARKKTTRTYAVGIFIVQLAWLGSLLAPDGSYLYVFALLVACELAVPAIAERSEPTTWHPHHIVERYGLFTIIVLGESFLSGIKTVAGLSSDGIKSDYFLFLIGAVSIVFALWWIYFSSEFSHKGERSNLKAFLWGYGHYFVLASIVAFGAGVEISIEYLGHHAHISELTAKSVMSIPAAAFLISFALVDFTWLRNRARLFLVAGITSGIFILPFVGISLLAHVFVLSAMLWALVVASEFRPKNNVQDSTSLFG